MFYFADFLVVLFRVRLMAAPLKLIYKMDLIYDLRLIQ